MEYNNRVYILTEIDEYEMCIDLEEQKTTIAPKSNPNIKYFLVTFTWKYYRYYISNSRESNNFF